MKRFFFVIVAIALIVGSFLMFKESPQDRAHRHYDNALSLIAAGDVPRASVEFFNVFKYDPTNTDARRTYANLMRDTGNRNEAYGQFLRLIEQESEDVESRIILATMQVGDRDWDGARIQIARLTELAGDDDRVRALQAILSYYDALIGDVASDRFAALARAEKLKSDVPDMVVLRDTIIDGLIRAENLEEALAEIDERLALKSDDIAIFTTRLAVLDALERSDAVSAQLQDLLERFPDDEGVQRLLVMWFMSRNDLDGAESVLRDLAQTEGDPGRVVLLRFLVERRGADVALAEIDQMIADGASASVFGALRASLDFEAGRTDAAIDSMSNLIAASENLDQAHSFRVAMAVMLDKTGARNRAEAEVTAVLADDPDNVDAAVLRARWLLDRRETDQAILLLRGAADRRSDDADILRLLARAHEMRAENELRGRMLALAFDVSGNAPQDALAYAGYLQADGKLGAAINVLDVALRQTPTDLDLLIGLGSLYIQRQDWERVSLIEEQSRALGTVSARAAADQLRSNSLVAQGRPDEALSLLEAQSAPAEGGPAAYIGVVRSLLLAGQVDRAMSLIGSALAEFPDDPGLLLVNAVLQSMTGNADASIAIYRDLLKQTPESEFLWLQLLAELRRMNADDEAMQAVSDARAAVPNSLHLRWINGILREEAGDVDGAIAIYEEINALNSAIPTVANNLAYLLATTRADSQSLDRAAELAETIKTLPQPEFRDTYGWVAFRRGDLDTALEWQIAAADELPRSADAQHRAGQILLEAGQIDAARARLNAALELVPSEQSKLRNAILATREALDADG